MKKKTIIKIVLDVLMMIVLALMYSKRALGMGFHEIGGLILIGVFLIHKGLNFSWIRRVTVKLAKADGRTRLMWIVDALMLVAFLLIGLSGILISKVAFPSLAVQGGSWKVIHYSASAVALILVGVHLGLHYNYLKGIFSRRIKLPKLVAVALAVVIMAYGGYGIATTAFTRWLAMPFSTSAQGGQGARDGQYPGMMEQRSGEGTVAQDSETNDASAVTLITQTDAAAQTSGDAEPMMDTAEANSLTDTQEGFLGRPDGMAGHAEGQQGSIGSALETSAQYFSITFLFAAMTALIDRLLRKSKKQSKV